MPVTRNADRAWRWPAFWTLPCISSQVRWERLFMIRMRFSLLQSPDGKERDFRLDKLDKLIIHEVLRTLNRIDWGRTINVVKWGHRWEIISNYSSKRDVSTFLSSLPISASSTDCDSRLSRTDIAKSDFNQMPSATSVYRFGKRVLRWAGRLAED